MGCRAALLAGGLVLAVTAGVAGCGAARELSAKDAVTAAVEAVADARTATFTVSLDSTVADLQKLAEESSARSSTDAATLQRLLDGELSVTMTAPDGSTLADVGSAQQGFGQLSGLLQDPAQLKQYMSAQGSSAIAIRLSGKALFELRSVGTSIYARADLPELLRLTGKDPALANSFAGSVPPALEPIAKATQGEWVAVDVVEALGSLKSSGVLDRLPTQDMPSSASPAATLKLLDSLRAAYEQHARIVEIGTDRERGTGYRLTAPVKQVAEAISTDLIELAGPESAKQIRAGIADMPERDLSVVLWVKDDALRAVWLDLGQFSERPVNAQVALAIDVDLDGAEVSAPKGANKLNVAEALVGMGALMGAGVTRTG